MILDKTKVIVTVTISLGSFTGRTSQFLLMVVSRKVFSRDASSRYSRAKEVNQNIKTVIRVSIFVETKLPEVHEE